MTGSMGRSQGGDPLSGGASATVIAGRWTRLPFPARHSTLSLIAKVGSYAAIAIGVALRVLQLLANRSLSQDEAQLALNIMHRSLSGLFRPLDFLQGAPAGFLVLQNLAVETLGDHEYSFRLVSFVAGTLAVVLILFLAQETLAPAAVPLAVLLFAVSDPLITWTVYAKPYALDVLVAIVILWFGLRVLHQPNSLAPIVLLAGAGVAAIWLSNPSVFVLAGVSTALVGGALVRKEWRRGATLSLASVAWLSSFAVFAFTYLHNLSSFQSLDCASCFAKGGSPGSSESLSGIHSLRDSFGEFRYVAGVPHFLDYRGNDLGLLVFLVAIGFCVLGLRSLAGRQPEAALMLLAPLIFMLIAWMLHKYPTLGRTQLFLVPNFVLLLGEGTAYAVLTVRRTYGRALIAICSVVIAVAIAAPSFGHIANPRSFEDLKPVLGHLAKRQRPGSTLYLYYTAQYQFRYYLECGCGGAAFESARKSGLWPLKPGAAGRDLFAPALRSVPPRLIVAKYRDRDPSHYISDFDALRGKKSVWFLLSSLENPRRTRPFLLEQLDRRGTQRVAFVIGKGKGAAGLYLYDMTQSGR